MRNLILPFLLLSLFLLSSCSTFNCQSLERYLGTNGNLITLSYRIADHLINRSMPPLMPRHPELAILTATFVDDNNLDETSRFGRILQQHISSRLVQKGYTVREWKLRHDMLMREKQGEIMLSRELSKITAEQSIQAVLVGTYSYTNDIMYLSARLVEPRTRNILATYDYQICMDDNILAMFGLMRKSPGGDEVQPPKQSIINSIFY
ncbi:MAG: FlgO family outer membrane protein [Thermodesulfobacteriota bacterium]